MIEQKPNKTLVEANDFPLFQRLVRRAITRQHGSLTWGQYLTLSSSFLSVQPPREAGLLIGWAHFHVQRLRESLKQAGVTVRPEPGWRPRPLSGSVTGFRGLAEAEKQLQKRAARRRRQT